METWNRAAAAHSRGSGVPAPPPPPARHRRGAAPPPAGAPLGRISRLQRPGPQLSGFRASRRALPGEAAPEAAAAAPAMWDPRAARCVAARETRGAPPARRAPRLFPAGSGGARGLATPERSSPWAPRSSKVRSGPVARARARGAASRPRGTASRPRGTRARAATGLRLRAACPVPTPAPKLRLPGPPPTSRAGPRCR